MKENCNVEGIVVERIDAGIEPDNGKGLIIDCGNLKGLRNFSPNYRGNLKEVNANISIGERSACGKLSELGIYVPKMIVKYADCPLTDEMAIDYRYGVNLSRHLTGQQLFDFAEAKREDGTYLMEASLTESELKKVVNDEEYDINLEHLQELREQLMESAQRRQYYKEVCDDEKEAKENSIYSELVEKVSSLEEKCKDVCFLWDLRDVSKEKEIDIKNSIPEVIENTCKYIDEDGVERKICILDHTIKYGSTIANALGCDYFIAVTDKELDFNNLNGKKLSEDENTPLATFAICAKPGERIPKKVVSLFTKLRDEGVVYFDEDDTMVKLKIVHKRENGTIDDKKEQGDNNLYISETGSMIVMGGKANNIFLTTDSDNLIDYDNDFTQFVIDEITDVFESKKDNIKSGIRVIIDEEKVKHVKSVIKGYKMQSAVNLVNGILSSKYPKLFDVENEGKDLLGLCKGKNERGESKDGNSRD